MARYQPLQTEDSGKEASQLVEDILRQVDERERNVPPPPPARKGSLMGRISAVLAPLLLVGVAVQAAAFYPQPAPATAEDLETLRLELYLISQELETYRRAYGALPQDLAEIGLEDEDVQYSRTRDDFALTAADGDLTVEYRPGGPEDEELEDRRRRMWEKET